MEINELKNSVSQKQNTDNHQSHYRGISPEERFPERGNWSKKLRSLLRYTALRAAIPLQFISQHRPANGFGILMYHRVTEPIPGVPAPTYNVSPKQLFRQLNGLLRRGYTPLPLREVLAIQAAGEKIPNRTFVVTFDDGYANNFLYAAPVLKQLKVPATVFLATAYLDSKSPFPFDDWPLAGSAKVPIDSWRALTTDECFRMSADGLIELGAHTHTHSDFRNRPDDLLADLQQCRHILQSRFQIDNPTFALPYGTYRYGFSGPVFSQIAEQAGMTCCLTTEKELARHGTSPFNWGRFTAEPSDTALTLSVKLSGCFEQLRSVWNRAKQIGRTVRTN